MSFFLLSLVIAGTAAGDLFLTIGMKQHDIIDDFSPNALGRSLAMVIRNPWVLFAIAAFAVSFFSFMGLLSVAELSFAVPATASAYIIEILLARLFLRETISAHRWMGALLVAVGVVLLSL